MDDLFSSTSAARRSTRVSLATPVWSAVPELEALDQTGRGGASDNIRRDTVRMLGVIEGLRSEDGSGDADRQIDSLANTLVSQIIQSSSDPQQAGSRSSVTRG